MDQNIIYCKSNKTRLLVVSIFHFVYLQVRKIYADLIESLSLLCLRTEFHFVVILWGICI